MYTIYQVKQLSVYVNPCPPCAGDEESRSTSATASAELPDLLKFSEVKGDLFSCPSTSSLAHCVSEDMAMGKGVAVIFKKEFGGVGELRAQGKECKLLATVITFALYDFLQV